jgi:hypothetical protein
MVNQAPPTRRETGGDQQDLSRRRARRLARRAQMWRRGGSRGRLARRAWRILVAASNSGDGNAIDAVWQAWLRAGNEELWPVLSGWPNLRDIAADVCTAAVNPRVPADQRALIGALCARHGLVPGGDVQRALFYVLTGQAGQHRAADPDGSLLATAYWAAAEPTRAAVRAAIAQAGDLDLVRLVASADGPDRVALLTAAECPYLASQLASRSDWDRLWRLVKDFPLAEAVAAMPLLPGRWRPGGDRDGFLFDRLNGVSPSALAAAEADLKKAALRQIRLYADFRKAGLRRVPRGVDYPSEARCSFSPDARRLAVVIGSQVMFFGVPGLTRAGEYRAGSPESKFFRPSGLLCVGDAVLACGSFVLSSRRRAATAALMRYTGKDDKVLFREEGSMHLAYHPDGFILQHVPGGAGGSSGDGGRRIQLHTAGGHLLQDIPIPAGSALPDADGEPWVTAADRETGLIALGGNRLWIYHPGARRVLASSDPLGRVTGGGWIGPDRIAVTTGPARPALTTQDQCRLHAFRLAAPGLELEGSRSIEPSYGWANYLALDPASNEIAVFGNGIRGVDYYDANNLAIRGPRETVGSAECSSADGRYLAIVIYREWLDGDVTHIERTLHVADRWLTAVGWLARQPMAALKPSDLAIAEAARGVLPGSPASPLLDLFAACVKHRFGADVGIGRSAPGIGDDEIGISRAMGGSG